MPNMAQAVSRQNKKLLNEGSHHANIKETVSIKVEKYTGMTAREFKDRWREHKYDIRNPSDKQKTRLSTHTWKLKDKSIDFDVKWSLIEGASDYNPITRKCRVCLKEKFILCMTNLAVPSTKDRKSSTHAGIGRKSSWKISKPET